MHSIVIKLKVVTYVYISSYKNHLKTYLNIWHIIYRWFFVKQVTQWNQIVYAYSELYIRFFYYQFVFCKSSMGLTPMGIYVWSVVWEALSYIILWNQFYKVICYHYNNMFNNIIASINVIEINI